MTTNVHTAIHAVYGKVGYVQKQKAANLTYTFASEAALIEALRPAMIDEGLYVHVLKVNDVFRETYTTKQGTVMNRTSITATVRFTHAPTATWIDCETIGEGSDAGDKSAPKALTGCYKYALRETFCIETGDDPDRDSSEPMERGGWGKMGGDRVPDFPTRDVDEDAPYCACGQRMGLKKSQPGAAKSWMGYFCPVPQKDDPPEVKDQHPPVWL